MVDDWVVNVSGNPGVIPGWYARMWISPASLAANGTGCKIFLTNSKLKVETTVDSVWVNSPGFEQRLQAFKGNLSTGLVDIAAAAEKKVNNASDQTYADLRRVYVSIALAQWYKKQSRQNAVFSELIDTNNITGLDIGFDKAYYEQQAWQHLYTFYHSGNYYYTVYGGVEML